MGAQYEKAVFLGEGSGFRGGQHNPPIFITYFLRTGTYINVPLRILVPNI